MTEIIRKALIEEITDMVTAHFTALNEFVAFAPPQVEALDCLLAKLERLSDLCSYKADGVSFELYHEVREYLDELTIFFRQVNQDTDAAFTASQVGQIWLQGHMWCDEAGKQFQVSSDEVWALLDPVKPDHLKDLGSGTYEARWWKPVPMMDVELLRYTEGIVVQGQPFEPDNLPQGIAVRFSVNAAPEFVDQDC